MVRAKVVCTAKEPQNDGFRLVFLAVTSGSEENETFFSYTPALSLEMGTINEAAAGQFEAGKEYYLDFTAAQQGVGNL